jgi:hypothetical protein
MSEEMTQHVLSAIVDQIPNEYLANAHTLIEQRLGWQSVYIIDATMWCFVNEITDRVEQTLEDIGQWSQENQEYWDSVCNEEWQKRFSDPKANIYDYGECLSECVIEDLQENIRDAFIKSDDVHDLMRDTILKHYGVQQ